MSYTDFQRARQDRVQELLDNQSSGGWLSQMAGNFLSGLIRNFSKVGGLPGMIIGFVADKVINEGILGDVDYVGASSLLPKEQRESYVQGIKDDAMGDVTSSITEGIRADIKAFGKEYGLDPKEAKQAYWETIRNRENWGDFLTGQDEFDFSTPMADAMPTGPELTRSDKKLLKEGIKDIESEDIGAPTFKDRLLNSLNPDNRVVDPLDMENGKIQGGYQVKNILGNYISGRGMKTYSGGEMFQNVLQNNIMDFDIEDPAGYEEILNLIEDMETGS
tara:strand:+ start:8887 stop:9714 length:828 start_codon:yes stop_codon:yes gene_type:complete